MLVLALLFSLLSKMILDEKKISEIFHTRFIIKHSKINTLFDSGSQVNIIYEEIVKKLGLDITPHSNLILMDGCVLMKNCK